MEDKIKLIEAKRDSLIRMKKFFIEGMTTVERVQNAIVIVREEGKIQGLNKALEILKK